MELIIKDNNNSTYNLNWAWYGETYYELKAPLHLQRWVNSRKL